MINTNNLPQIIFMYGPAGCGKGTQAQLLEKSLQGYKHVEFGKTLRSFAEANLQNPQDSEKHAIAVRMHRKMTQGLGIELEDLKYVIEDTLLNYIKSGQKIILDGAGRSVEEAEWQADFFEKNNITSAVFHLYIPLETTVQRTVNRWYLRNNNKIFRSYEEAKLEAKEGEDPYQREDDLEIERIRNRYFSQYNDIVAKVLRVYQLTAGTDVFFVDGRKSVDSVHRFVLEILAKKYK